MQIYLKIHKNAQKVYIYYVYIQKERDFCKNRCSILWVSCGYGVGILWRELLFGRTTDDGWSKGGGKVKG